MNGRILTKVVLLAVVLLLAASVAGGSDFVHGRIYLKDGRVLECADGDRIRLPKRSGKAIFLKNAYTDLEEKEKFSAGQIDSIVAWHPATPEHVRKFVPSETPGWLWVYFETPKVCVCIYSEKGYGIGANGGIEVLQWQGLIFRSRTAYCLRRAEEETFEVIGSANGISSEGFRRKLAEFVGDNPDLAERILESRGRRDKTVMMLEDYQ